MIKFLIKTIPIVMTVVFKILSHVVYVWFTVQLVKYFW